MDKEIWKDIQGYEELYQVSNLGRIKSLERKVTINNITKTYKSKIIKRVIKDGGTAFVKLRKDEIIKSFTVGRLVYKAFNPDFDETDFSVMVIQKDGNKTNNQIDNLYIENRKKVIGSFKKPVICLTTNKEFESALKASEYYNCDRSSITKCCKGKMRWCGELENKEPLVWLYLEDYKNKTKEELNLILNNVKNPRYGKRVLCITTNRTFDSIPQANKYYNISTGSIDRCCKGDYEYAGKLEDGTKLNWCFIGDKKNMKTIRKPINISYWLYEKAEKNGLNYTELLEDAIKKKLNLKE